VEKVYLAAWRGGWKAGYPARAEGMPLGDFTARPAHLEVLEARKIFRWRG
jgi:hypothetical protein